MSGDIGRRLVADMEALTFARIGVDAFENGMANLAHVSRGRSIAALRNFALGEGDTAVVIGAGPSIKRRDPARALRESGYRGAIIATDSALSYCLREGVVPHLVVTVDPHATRIVRWFGDPGLSLEHLASDDYFRRQDMDEAFAAELKINREVLDLVERHGKDIRIALATSSSQPVVERALSSGMDVYWWNPMIDDPDRPDSLTRRLQQQNRFPAINAVGNVGAACWMIAHAVLGKREIALTGLDFGYYDDTPHTKTQYYREAVSLVGEGNLEHLFMRVFNPYLNQWFYTDPAYMWYRESFLAAAGDTDCRTINCTEGGILFGGNISFEPLTAFLARHAPRSAEFP